MSATRSWQLRRHGHPPDTHAMGVRTLLWLYTLLPASMKRSGAFDGMQAYWQLDESSGLIAENSSGHGITGKFSEKPNCVALDRMFA
jgi:hypothetical protein